MAFEATAPEPPKKGPSIIIQGAVLLVLSLAAAGGGWFAGMQLRASDAPAEPQSTAPVKVQVEPMAGTGEAGADGHGGGAEEAKGSADAPGEEVARDEEGNIILIPRLVPLEPVTTNLAAPRDVWVRMELAIVFTAPPAPEMLRAIHDDIMAYMRTVTLQQVNGASGFRHLKTDLEERARIRSDGLATELLIRTLLFE